MYSDNQKVYCETSTLRILLLLVVFNVLRFVMKFPLRDCANVPSLPLLDLQSLGFCQKRLHASHPSSWILNKLKTYITSHSQDLHFSSYCLDPHRIPTSRTLTTTEATRSQSTRGNRCSRTLRGTFPFPSRTSWTAATWPVWRTTSKAWSHQGPVGKSLILWDRWRWDVFPDSFSFFGMFHVYIGFRLDLSDQTIDKSSNCPQIQTRNHRSASEALAEKHQRSRSSTPVVLPHIYVYHRYKHEQNWIKNNLLFL